MISEADSEDVSAFLLDEMSLLSDMRAAVLECRKRGKPVYVLIPDKESFEPELMYKLFTKVCISLKELIENL